MDVSAEPADGVDEQLAERAWAEGLKLTGEGGLLARLTEVGSVQIEVPRDRESAFDPVIFIDAVNVKIREGNVADRPIYVVLAVTVEGERDILGSWAGEHGDGEGAKYWMRVLTEIKNRGTQDCLIVVCDGLKGLPEAIATVWPQTIVQTCLVHLLRISFKYASKKDWATIAKDLKTVCTVPSESAALDAFAEFSQKWEKKYPAIIRLWTNAWAEFVPFLWFDQEIRTIICTTNAIESINAQIRRAVNAGGYFPTEAAALERVYLEIMNLDPTGKGQQRWSNRWKGALNAFEITFDGRCPPHGSNTPTRSSYTVNLTDPTGCVPNLIEC